MNLLPTTSYNLQTFFFISSQSSTIEERNSKIREWSKFTVCLSVFYLYAELENDPSLLSVCLSVWEHLKKKTTDLCHSIQNANQWINRIGTHEQVSKEGRKPNEKEKCWTDLLMAALSIVLLCYLVRSDYPYSFKVIFTTRYRRRSFSTFFLFCVVLAFFF